MEIINNNPYRILGVYANSPLRERVANASKARAFLKVGRNVSFPLDLPDSINPLCRTEDSLAQAESSVALPNEQLRYALFWFIRTSVVDDVALKNLMAGDLPAAEDVWRKRECMTSAHNLIVYALVRSDLKLAVKYAENFFDNHDYVSQFAQVVVGDDSSCGDLATIFLDALCEEFDAEDVFYLLGDCELREMVSQRVTDKYVGWIENCLSETHQAHGVACLKAGEYLLECAEDWLTSLSDELETLSTSDIRYRSLCEKVSSEIIRCAREYYRASTADEKAQNAIGLLSARLLRWIARNNENIRNEVSKLISFFKTEQERQKIAEPLAAIDAATKRFKVQTIVASTDVVFNSIKSYLNTVKSHLISIKNTIGVTPFYLNKSTECVSLAFDAVVKEVYVAQICADDKFVYRDVISKAIEVERITCVFDMTNDYKVTYKQGREILWDLERIIEKEKYEEERKVKMKEKRVFCLILGYVMFSIVGSIVGGSYSAWFFSGLVGAFIGYMYIGPRVS